MFDGKGIEAQVDGPFGSELKGPRVSPECTYLHVVRFLETADEKKYSINLNVSCHSIIDGNVIEKRFIFRYQSQFWIEDNITYCWMN